MTSGQAKTLELLFWTSIFKLLIPCIDLYDTSANFGIFLYKLSYYQPLEMLCCRIDLLGHPDVEKVTEEGRNWVLRRALSTA